MLVVFVFSAECLLLQFAEDHTQPGVLAPSLVLSVVSKSAHLPCGISWLQRLHKYSTDIGVYTLTSLPASSEFWTNTPLFIMGHFSFLGEVQGPYFDRGHIALAIYHTLDFQWKCKVWRGKKNVSSLLNGVALTKRWQAPRGRFVVNCTRKKHFLKMPGYRHQIDFKAQKAN